MNILVTGTDGYIGSLLGPLLMDRGHEVVGLDTGFYRDSALYNSRVRTTPRRTSWGSMRSCILRSSRTIH